MTFYAIHTRLDNGLGRTGIIHTPHGDIQTPAFIPVATRAAVKAVLPEAMAEAGAQALLSNAYHLYLQPGDEILDAAGGLAKFMNWGGPTFTDSGGFQVLSLGAGFKKVLAMQTEGIQSDDVIAEGKERLATVDDDGVSFKSHIDGSMHRFTPERSMQIQHNIGADIMFAFDELTTLMITRSYQEDSLERTRLWAERCLAEHKRLTEARANKPYQALFGVLQGANYEDLRRKAARDLGSMEIDSQQFDGFGLGGAIEKQLLGEIVGWMTSELPEDRPRHLLGISEPDDLFAGVEAGVDTFDCVSPTRVARNAAVYSKYGRYNLTQAKFKTDFNPIEPDCQCYTCQHYTRAYLRYLFKAGEFNAKTLCSIHNEYFILKLVDDIRRSIDDGTFYDLKAEVLGNYYGKEC